MHTGGAHAAREKTLSGRNIKGDGRPYGNRNGEENKQSDKTTTSIEGDLPQVNVGCFTFYYVCYTNTILFSVYYE